MENFNARLRIIPRIVLVAFTLIVVLAVVLYIGAYAYIALVRMPYPYELEWIESGFAGQVGRILAGQPLFGPPDIDFTPFLYTPLFFYLAAAAAKVTGAGFLPLRLVSFFSSIVAMGGMFAAVFRRKRNFLAGLLAAGLLAASYRITGAWMDVGRVDSLAVALLVLFCLALPSSPGRFRWLLSGLLAALMVLAKQSMLAAVLPFFLVHFLEYRRRALWMAAGFIVPLGLVTLWLNLTSGGWYSFYTFDLLFQQTEWLGPDVVIAFWKTDILRHYFPSIGFAAAGLFLLFRRERSEFWKWLSLLAGAVLCSFLARIKAGGYDNVLLPSIAVLGILLGVGWDRLTEKLIRDPHPLRDGAGVLLAVAALYQFYHLRYSPADQLPTDRDYRAGEAFVQYLAGFPGDVYVPYHTQYAAMAGKQPFAHQAALWDVLRNETPNRGKEILIGRIEDAVRGRRFDVIILDGAGQWNFLYGLEDYYSLQTEGIPPDGSPAPLTGWRISPQSVFLPLENAQPYAVRAADVRLRRIFSFFAMKPGSISEDFWESYLGPRNDFFFFDG